MDRKEFSADDRRPLHRILAIGDIHQAPNLNEIEAAIERIAPDITVFIGDYFDSFIYDHPDHVRRTAVWLKQGIQRPDRVYLLGNHDLPYAFPNLATCPGWTPEKQRIIRTVLEENDWLRFRLSYSPSPSWLFTHAGVSASLVPPGMAAVPTWVADQEAVALAFLKLGRPHWFFRGGSRRGDRGVGGPFWCDFSEFEPIAGLNQVFGHTPAAKGEPLIRVKTDPDSINVCIDASVPLGVRSVLLLEDGALSDVALPAFHHSPIAQPRPPDVRNEIADAIPFRRSYWVIPGKLLVGCYPSGRSDASASDKSQGLIRSGVTKIICLMDANETNHDGAQFQDYVSRIRKDAAILNRSIAWERHPIVDGYITTVAAMQAILNSIDDALEQGGVVYVHCWCGRGRTGTVVSCWLIRHGLANPLQAIDQIHALIGDKIGDFRPTPENARQRNFIEQWSVGL